MMDAFVIFVMSIFVVYVVVLAAVAVHIVFKVVRDLVRKRRGK